MNSSDFNYVIKGVIRGFLITLLLLFFYAIFVTYNDISPNISSILLTVISMISIGFGAIYSTKKIRKKGWIVGILVAVFYMILIYLLSIVVGQPAALSIKSIYKLIFALIIGMLSGILGINI